MGESYLPYLEDPIAITKSEDKDVPEHRYIMESPDFRVLFSESDNEIRHPVTIINVNYTDLDVSEKRIDFVTAHYTLRDECRNLRITAGEKVCMECDDYFARYFCALMEGGKGKAEKIRVPKSFVSSFKDGKPELRIREVKVKDKQYSVKHMHYLEYRCPMLGFTELCFPICFRGNTIAVMFVGEIQRESDKAERRAVTEAFIREQENSPNGIFEEYERKYEKTYSRKKLNLNLLRSYRTRGRRFYPDLLSDRNDTVANRIDRSLNEAEFQEHIRICCEEIVKIEKKLKEKWDEKCRLYYRKVIKEITKEFNRKYNETRLNARELSYEKMQEMFRAVWEAAIQLKEKLGFDYCRLYDNYLFIKGTYFANSFKMEKGDCDYKGLKFDFSEAGLSMAKLQNSLENKELLSRFTHEKSDERRPVSGNAEVALACENMAFLFGIKQNYQRHNDQLHICFEEICNEFIHICAEMENAALLFLENQHNRTLALYKHEMAHLAQRMQEKGRQIRSTKRLALLIEREIKFEDADIQRVSTFSANPIISDSLLSRIEAQRDLITEDIESITRTMQRLSTNIPMVLSTEDDSTRRLKLNIGYFHLYNELNKWRSTYRLELVEKNIRLDNESFISSQDMYYETDPELFSIMLFNLIDNAIKYAYWGTRITVEAYRDEIRIADYGIGVPAGDKERIFDLYYRSSEVKQEKMGDGIGLYSSKRIAELLGYTIRCESQEIAPFHLGFANQVMLENQSSKLKGVLQKHSGSYERYLQEYKNVITARYECSNEGRNQITERQIKDELLIPTYRVAFVINRA